MKHWTVSRGMLSYLKKINKTFFKISDFKVFKIKFSFTASVSLLFGFKRSRERINTSDVYNTANKRWNLPPGEKV